MRNSIYQRIGGSDAILAAVVLFYEKVLEDPELRPFFDQIDLDALQIKMVSFMARAFGGPNEYFGRDLRLAHENLVTKNNLSEMHFDLVTKHLSDTLMELEIDSESISEIIETVSLTKDEILNR